MALTASSWTPSPDRRIIAQTSGMMESERTVIAIFTERVQGRKLKRSGQIRRHRFSGPVTRNRKRRALIPRPERANANWRITVVNRIPNNARNTVKMILRMGRFTRRLCTTGKPCQRLCERLPSRLWFIDL